MLTLDAFLALIWRVSAIVLVPLSTLILIAAGYLIMASGGDTGRIDLGRKLIVGVFSGLGLLLLSYFLLVNVLGLSFWTGGGLWP